MAGPQPFGDYGDYDYMKWLGQRESDDSRRPISSAPTSPGAPSGTPGAAGAPGGSGGGTAYETGGPAAEKGLLAGGSSTTANASTPWWKYILGTGGANMDTWLNGALALYGISREGQTPNTYPVPLTKTEQETADAKKSLFNYSSAFTDQYLRGLNNLQPDYQLNTDAVGNRAFMGGVKIPQIDWSKIPSAPRMGATDIGANNVTPGDQGLQPKPSPYLPNETGSAGGGGIFDEVRQYGSTALAIAIQMKNAGKSDAEVMAVVRSMFGEQP